VVVGQIARDLVLVVDKVPGPGGSVDVDQRRELLGGKGANIGVGLAQLAVPVAVVGVVGDDLVGEELPAQCERDQLDTTAVLRRTGTESALMVDVVTADGQWRYLESVPACGGGDAFVAALTWALDRGEDQVRAGQLATAAAGLVVRHPGGRPAVDPAAVEEWAGQVGTDR
jgi:ribokinase